MRWTQIQWILEVSLLYGNSTNISLYNYLNKLQIEFLHVLVNNGILSDSIKGHFLPRFIVPLS